MVPTIAALAVAVDNYRYTLNGFTTPIFTWLLNDA